MAFAEYRTALVTGASGGIGAAVVERLRRERLEVHALARSRAALDELASRTGCIPHVIDITDTAALTHLVAPLEVDVLVNNAGVSRAGSILTSDVNDVDEQVEVNLKAVLHLVRLTLPGMVTRDRGHVINISSIAGLYHFSGHTVYHATKAAVHMLSRQLRIDAFGRRVRITEICAKVDGIVAAEAKRRYFEGFEIPQPADVADAIAYAIGTPVQVNIGLIEIMPTLQVPGGLRTARRDGEVVMG